MTRLVWACYREDCETKPKFKATVVAFENVACPKHIGSLVKELLGGSKRGVTVTNFEATP